VLFATDFPSESNKLAVEFMDTAPIISDSDREKIYHLNAEKLFRIT
jgi:predicted TIM-barrel fold metal-dependent hydrolase